MSMKRDCLKRLLTVALLFCAASANAQMPYSPCSQSGGKRVDVIGTEALYSSPGASAPVFNIPAGTKSISVYISSETGVTSGGNDFAQGDEDFISINAVIDLTTNTSSGYVNFAKNTFKDGSGTNLYGWQQAPLGAFIPASAKIGDSSPELNNVNFSILGNTLTITQSLSGVHSSFYVQYLSPYSNSLNPLDPQVKALLNGNSLVNTDLVMPIPAGTDVIFIAGKGTNSSYGDLNTSAGTEEGYSNLRFTIDLQKGKTTGFVTVANGGSANRRSTYAVNNLSSTYSGQFVGAGAAVTGDYNGKSGNNGAVGIYNPAIYVSGSNLVIKRDVDYARDFDDAYVVEFYKRAGQGMSAEFISSDIKIIPTGLSSTAGVSRTFDIPPGTNAIYFTEGGNAVNTDAESNENSLEAYAYIDLAAGTATGYFYQQVGLSQTDRRDDNFAFKGVPLDNTSARSHANTVGFKGPHNYDISFSLSADKSQLTVTNKTGLANPDYQLLLSIDNYGSKPDLAFGMPAVAFTKYSGTKTVKAEVTVCNPGAGNSTGGMPVSFYHGDPTSNPSARLLYTGAFPQAILAGECQTFSFDLDLSSFDNLNIDLTIIINDNGSYVPGGVRNEVGVPFTLASLATQHATFQECYYENNLVTGTIAVNNVPVLNPDPNKSSGATGNYSYLNFFEAGSVGARIMDADMTIVDPDAPDLAGATITLTNFPDAGAEALYLNGTLPAGITMTGNNTNVVQLTGQASQANYISAMKMLEYRNSNNTPNTADRTITAVVTDGIETSPVSTTTIVILTSPRINVHGNDIAIEDNSTGVSTANGTDYGMAAGSVMTHTFTIHNVGTGIINLTAPVAVSVTGDGFSIAAQPASNAIASGQSTNFAISFDPAGRAGGSYTAIVHVLSNDADADRADYTFTITATINILPVISDNSVSGFEDQVYVFKTTDFTAAYSDGNGSPLSAVRIESLPQNGTLRLDGVPVTIGKEIFFSDLRHLTFVPQGEWNGNTGFSWNASDGTAYAATPANMAIDIAAVNDAPVITLPANAAVTEDVPATIKDVLFEDIDVSTGNVTVTFSVAGGQLKAISGAGVTVGSSANVLVLSGSLTDINAFLAAGELTYEAPQAGPVSLDLIVNISDNGNTGTGGVLQDTKSMVLNISVVNDAPTGSGDTQTTNEDTPVSGAVTGADIDGDQLTFTKATDPANGTVVVNADGTYTYTPNANYHGTDNFTITIADGNGGSATVTVNITVSPVNDAPTGTGDTKTTNEDTPVSGAVTGADIDGDPITFTKATDPANGAVAVNADGTYTYTPNANYHGADNFTITIADGNGGSATVTVNITVSPVNDAPTGTGDTKTTNEDTPVSGAVTGADIDGDPITFTKATDPANGAVVVNADGTYTYTPKANYHGADNFTIAISDGGGSATVTVNITVSPVNDAPTGTGDTKTTNEDTPVSGGVTGADADGDQLTFTKATDPTNGAVVVNADGTYTYTPKANYHGADNFTITIADGNGGSATVTVNITVSPVNDVPTGSGDTQTTNEDTPVNGGVTGADVDGDQLTFTKATDPANGAVVVNADGTYTYTPKANYHGADNFTIAISDGNGGSATVTVNITVSPVNDAPAGTGDSQTTNEDTSVNGGVTGADVDGDQLTFSKATDPANGAVVVNADGTYTYTPKANYHGADNFTIAISDGGGSATVTVNITVSPVNDAPTGTGDTKTTNEDTPVSGAVTGADIDGDQLTFSKATDPANGTVVVNVDGTYTYTPKANYHGSDNFTIAISDGNGGSVTVTVNITVSPVNDAPTGTGDLQTTNEDTQVKGQVAGSDTDGDRVTFTKATDPANGTVVVDPDGTYTYMPNTNYHGPDNFNITVSDGNGGVTTVTVNVNVSPANDVPTGTGDTKTTNEDAPVSGGVTGADADGDQLTFTKATDPANGAAVVNTDGSYTYTPKANYHGADNFNITVSDGNGGSATVTVNITVSPVNDAPAGTGDSQTTNEDTPVNGTVTGVDIDGDRLTFALTTTPSNGTVIVNSDGSYTYTPNPDYNGADVFTVGVSDGHGGHATVQVNITVIPVNDTPTGTGDTKTTPEDIPVSGAVTAKTNDRINLAFSLATAPAHGKATVNSDGTYTYTPNANYHGADEFFVTVTDQNGSTIKLKVSILVTPVNDMPVGTGDYRTTLESTPARGFVTGADIDGDALTYTPAADPVHGSVVINNDGTYTYTPATGYTGPDSFKVNISDGKGGTVTVTVNIRVKPMTGEIALVKTAVLRSDNVSITYTFRVINSGNSVLHNIAVSDAMLGLNQKLPGELQPGASASITAVYKLTQEDRERGTVSNTAEAKALTPVNKEVNDRSGTDIDNDSPTETKVAGAPLAVNDEAGTRLNTPVTVPVLDNDDAGPSAFNRRSIRIITRPQHGQVVILGDGRVTYLPESSYSGNDAFTYRVQDMEGYITNMAAVKVTVEVEGLQIPTLFTPNGDGKNDAFEIRGLHKYAENELVIVNRWGTEVYRQKNYQQNWKGDGLNEGTYYYLLRVRKTSSSEWEIFKGYTTLLRKFKQ
jgi:gliding motility-associated-like protein